MKRGPAFTPDEFDSIARDFGLRPDARSEPHFSAARVRVREDVESGEAQASSLGASFGVAISAAIFTALAADAGSTRWLEGVITFAGRQDNVVVRQAAMVALTFNLLMVVAAIASIMLTVPKASPRGGV